MGKLGFSATSVLLLATLQAGCATMPGRANALRSSLELPRPICDTSVRYINLAARLQNTTNGDIKFHLDGDRGPRLDPWYLGYRVHSSAPGEPYQLVHNSGHDSVWTRTVAIAPGNSAEFNVPIFGLRPADYLRHFRIELRDSKGRSYWTPPFELCAVSQASCGCPQLDALSVSLAAPRRLCAVAPAPENCESCNAVEVRASCR